jgi:hypothetical protein
MPDADSRPLAGRHVAVLLGGLSSEREVSLVSGAACADALERLGARVSRVDAGRDLAQVLSRLSPDVCFNALHGSWGEDGCVQGVLETLGLPYTHSGVLASALAMDKTRAKAVLAAAGVPVPGGGLYDRREAAAGHVLPPPYVIKPNAEGSSVGVFIVGAGANSPPEAIAAEDWALGDQVLVEPYIPGLELAVGADGIVRMPGAANFAGRSLRLDEGVAQALAAIVFAQPGLDAAGGLVPVDGAAGVDEGVDLLLGHLGFEERRVPAAGGATEDGGRGGGGFVEDDRGGAGAGGDICGVADGDAGDVGEEIAHSRSVGGR